jgi:hypothetical protein
MGRGGKKKIEKEKIRKSCQKGQDRFSAAPLTPEA